MAETTEPGELMRFNTVTQQWEVVPPEAPGLLEKAIGHLRTRGGRAAILATAAATATLLASGANQPAEASTSNPAEVGTSATTQQD